MIAYSIVEGIGIERPGEDSWVTISTLSSSTEGEGQSM
jgi:hypothetical protein